MEKKGERETDTHTDSRTQKFPEMEISRPSSVCLSVSRPSEFHQGYPQTRLPHPLMQGVQSSIPITVELPCITEWDSPFPESEYQSRLSLYFLWRRAGVKGVGRGRTRTPTELEMPSHAAFP